MNRGMAHGKWIKGSEHVNPSDRAKSESRGSFKWSDPLIPFTGARRDAA